MVDDLTELLMNELTLGEYQSPEAARVKLSIFPLSLSCFNFKHYKLKFSDLRLVVLFLLQATTRTTRRRCNSESCRKAVSMLGCARVE